MTLKKKIFTKLISETEIQRDKLELLYFLYEADFKYFLDEQRQRLEKYTTQNNIINFKDLKKRASLKVETNCDIFISIHENMFPQAKCFGAQVWYASNTDSEKLANIVQDSIKVVVNDGNKRVAKPAGEAYLILRDKYEGASILV